VCNVEGLAKLHRRTAAIFNANALEPPSASSELLGAKIRANRLRKVPEGVAALAQRIVEEDGSSSSSDFASQDDVDPDAFLDGMSSSLIEEDLLSVENHDAIAK